MGKNLDRFAYIHWKREVPHPIPIHACHIHTCTHTYTKTAGKN